MIRILVVLLIPCVICQEQNKNRFSLDQGELEGHFEGNKKLENIMEEVYLWKQIGYDGIQSLRFDAITFPSNDSKMSLDFVPYNNVPMGVDHFEGRLFITMPRRRTGIPSTLNYIDMNLNSRNRSPLLKPFPDIMATSLPTDLRADPNKIISVYRTRTDECKRLWFVDTGLLEYPDNAMQIQPPSIWIMNPKNGNVIRRFEFPANIEQRGNGVASITVDVNPRNCNEAFAYIPDLFFNRIYVYSFKDNRMWSFYHNYFRMDPFEGDLNIAGHQFQWDDGIFSITLGPRRRDTFRDVYFHPMISTNEFVVSSEVLQNEENSNRQWHGSDFHLLGNRGPGTQSAMHQFDLTTGVLFFSEIGRNAIGCMNSDRPINKENHAIVAQDNDRMIYPSDLKVDVDGTLWVFTNTMPRFIYSQLNTSEYNFRIWKANSRDIIRGTICSN
uniref:CSON006707 protein n=1 Tax=Culicoides sonorensis TaxID=179676 RepID=A0A336MSU8_CULSO